jgi:hypothetical protein
VAVTWLLDSIHEAIWSLSATSLKAPFFQFALAVLVCYSWKALVDIVLLAIYIAVLCVLPAVRLIHEGISSK